MSYLNKYDQLREKVCKELEDYKQEVTSYPGTVIFDMAENIMVRQDIAGWFDSNCYEDIISDGIKEAQVDTLLSLPNTLEEIANVLSGYNIWDEYIDRIDQAIHWCSV